MFLGPAKDNHPYAELWTTLCRIIRRVLVQQSTRLNFADDRRGVMLSRV